MTTTEDWTKFVTLNPPNEVKFVIVDDNELAKSQSVDPTKAVAKIQIINKSKSAILFKVRQQFFVYHPFLGENNKYQELYGEAQCWFDSKQLSD